jgi:hypothetical protein
VVTDSATRGRLSSVLVRLGGDSRTTDANGYYEFQAVDLSFPLTMTATKTGYAQYTATLSGRPGITALTHDFAMAPTASRPVVTGIQPQYDGFFLANLPLQNRVTANVAWNGTPGTVEFYANSRLKQTVTGSTSGASATFNMGQDFSGSLTPGANQVRVVARNAEGLASDTFRQNVCVLPLPPALTAFLPNVELQPKANGTDVHVALDFTVPDPPLSQNITLPVIGRWGVEVAANGSFDYTLADGDWEVALGVGAEGRQGKRGRRPRIPGLTRSPKMKLYIGNKEASFSVSGMSRGHAGCTSGVTLDSASLAVALGLKLELGRVGILDLVGPGLSTGLGKIPGLSGLLNTISVLISLQPQFDGNATFDLNPQFAFERLQVAGDVALLASYEPNLGIAKMNFYVGGRPGMTLQIPPPLIKQLRFRAYAGVSFETWLVSLGPYEYAFVNVTIPAGSGALIEPGTYTFVQKAIAPDWAGERPMARDYLNAGPPRFVAPRRQAELAAFRALSRRSDSGAVLPLGTADLTLVENVFPNGQPALAANGNEMILLYVSDNGAGSLLQRTDINWMRYDGTSWSAPRPILADTRAEFAPQVAFDGKGDAIGVWERVKNPNFNTVDLSAMAAEMEIVWSRWDRTTGQWSEPAPLTSNDHLDHLPLLAGPMADGSLLLVWTENAQNLLLGNTDAGDASRDTVRWSRWDPNTRTWSTAQTLVTHAGTRTSQALAGAATSAVYAWTEDRDGNLGDPNDADLRYATWNGAAWVVAPHSQGDTVADRNVRAAVDAAGTISLVWQRGADLVLDRNLAGNPTLVRSDSQTVGFSDYAMTAGPGGNLALVWHEQSKSGVDAHYAVYDAAAARWSEDEQLFADAALERSFAPAWDDAGNLVIAYNRVQISTGPKTVTTEGGETLTIDNVPQPGRVDLAVVKRALAKDVGFKAGDFTADGAGFLPGDRVTLTATVRNLGDLPVENVQVAFYDGDPALGGVEILPRQTVPGVLDGAASAAVTAEWIMPGPAVRHTLYAVLDPDHLLAEANRGNNQLSLEIGGIDLAASLVSRNVGRDGSARVVVEVVNRGAPAAPISTVAIRYAEAAAGSPPLATAVLPGLDPGVLAQVGLDLPAGSVGTERLFTVTADDASAVADIDRSNNNVTFAMGVTTSPCPGDCGGDGQVTIDELITMVNIALGTKPVSECSVGDTSGDGDITIDEIIQAVNRALNGC